MTYRSVGNGSVRFLRRSFAVPSCLLTQAAEPSSAVSPSNDENSNIINTSGSSDNNHRCDAERSTLQLNHSVGADFIGGSAPSSLQRCYPCDQRCRPTFYIQPDLKAPTGFYELDDLPSFSRRCTSLFSATRKVITPGAEFPM